MKNSTYTTIVIVLVVLLGVLVFANTLRIDFLQRDLFLK